MTIEIFTKIPRLGWTMTVNAMIDVRYVTIVWARCHRTGGIHELESEQCACLRIAALPVTVPVESQAKSSGALASGRRIDSKTQVIEHLREMAKKWRPR